MMVINGGFYEHTKRRLKTKQEMWRQALENRELRIRMTKTECLTTQQKEGTRQNELKYLRLILETDD